MNTIKRFAVVAAMSTLAGGLSLSPVSAQSVKLPASAQLSAPAERDTVAARGCVDKVRTVWVRGTRIKRGKGAVTVCTGGGKLTINGYVKDFSRDGACAQLYGTTNKGQSWSKKACGKGTLKDINRTFRGASSTTVKLRVA